MVTEFIAGKMYLKAPQKAIPRFPSTNSLLLTLLPKSNQYPPASLETQSPTQLKLNSLPNYQNSLIITNPSYRLDIHMPREGKEIHAIH